MSLRDVPRIILFPLLLLLGVLKLIDAKVEELLARAEAHKKGGVLDTSQFMKQLNALGPVKVDADSDLGFEVCVERETEAFFNDLVPKGIACRKHGVPAGVPCPPGSFFQTSEDPGKEKSEPEPLKGVA